MFIAFDCLMRLVNEKNKVFGGIPVRALRKSCCSWVLLSYAFSVKVCSAGDVMQAKSPSNMYPELRGMPKEPSLDFGVFKLAAFDEAFLP